MRCKQKEFAHSAKAVGRSTCQAMIGKKTWHWQTSW